MNLIDSMETNDLIQNLIVLFSGQEICILYRYKNIIFNI